MGHVLVRAAREAGLRIALIDACYVSGGPGTPLTGAQLRFGDGDADGWAVRAEELAAAYRGEPDVEIGAAIHSVRAVPAEQMPVIAEFSRRHAAPLHAHVSEQRAENTACVETYAATPVQVLHEHGALGPRSTAVHATHLSEVDVELLGQSGTHVCMCPTTERDLADGIGPARKLYDRGSAMTLGSDSHAVIDLFEEARAVELDERLASERRGHWSAAELLRAATVAGHLSLGFPDAGHAPARRVGRPGHRTPGLRTYGGRGRAGGGGVRGDGGRRALGDLRRPPGGQRGTPRAGRRRSHADRGDPASAMTAW